MSKIMSNSLELHRKDTGERIPESGRVSNDMEDSHIKVTGGFLCGKGLNGGFISNIIGGGINGDELLSGLTRV
ncbi:MAG: hypothetical protein FWG14_04655 [Peptococcaceae bacterium]|nr:hypothetical protein [Peptococcaceae bacterium]